MSEAQDICVPLPARDEKARHSRYELLEAWYGRKRAENEISAHTIQPRTIEQALEKVLSKIRRPENGVVIHLRSQWNDIVGNMFARFTEPEMLKDGVLTLKVRHSAMLVELKPSCDLIRDKVNKVSGEEVCREIRLRV